MKNYVDIEYREHLGQFLNEQGLLGEMAEIGCAYGGYAEFVLRAWRGQRYHMIDPWARQSNEIYRESTAGIDPEAQYRQCVGMAAKDKRIVIHRAYSLDAVKTFADGALDCVFLDGNHSYEAVRDDLRAWWPKVKAGGIFSGHDYGNDTSAPNWCEVKRAVDEWAVANRQTFVYSRCNSWWILK